MMPLPYQLYLSDPTQTEALARAVAPHLRAGDTLALSGEIGAGKSVFARALIHTRLAEYGVDEDVPSPTYTLVQTYQAGGLEIWHTDLYRLTHPDELRELGLEEAFDTALCLIEWPGRIADMLPRATLRLRFDTMPAEAERRLTVQSAEPAWADRVGEVLMPWAAAHV